MLEELINELQFLNSTGRPAVTAIRRLKPAKRVGNAHNLSFTFEACIAGVWHQYGPHVFGNYTNRSAAPYAETRSPESDPMYAKMDIDSIPIGFYQLRNLWICTGLDFDWETGIEIPVDQNPGENEDFDW